MSEAQAQAQAQALEETKILDDYPSESLMRVLYVEDKEDYLKRIGKLIRNWGCYVDSIKYPIDALQLLHKNKYQLVIFDHAFPDGHMTGLDFILQYRNMIGSAKPILLTQYANVLRNVDEVDKDWITVIDKQYYKEQLPVSIKEVYGIVCKKIDENKNQLTTNSNPNYPLAEEELKSLQEELIVGLEKSENINRKSIAYEDERYSIADLIEQVRKGTELGARLVRSYFGVKKMQNKLEKKYGSKSD